MRTKLTIAAATAALATGGIAAAGAGATASSTAAAKAPTTVSAAATRHLEGHVTAIDRSARAFTVRDAERGTLKVKVTSSTTFERTSHFTPLRVGARGRRPYPAKVDGSWRATKVERGVPTLAQPRRRRRPRRRTPRRQRRPRRAPVGQAQSGGHRPIRMLLLALAAAAILVGGAATVGGHLGQLAVRWRASHDLSHPGGAGHHEHRA